MIAWKAYEKKNRSLLKMKRRQRFTLSEPNDELKEHFFGKIKRAFLHCNKTFSELTSLYEEKFQNTCIRLSKNELQSAVQRIIAKKLLLLVLNHCRQIAGHFLGTIRCIKRYAFNDVASFGVRYHVKGGEPYYREASYSHLQEDSKDLGGHIDNIVDGEGTLESKKDSIIVSDDEAEDQLINVKNNRQRNKWDCSAECRPVQQHEIDVIVELRKFFDNPKRLRKHLEDCDSGCPNKKDVDRKGHPLICHTADCCTSKLRILRAVSTHFPKLRTFLRCIYKAIKYHQQIKEVDRALNTGNITFLKDLITADKINGNESLYEKLISGDDKPLMASNVANDTLPLRNDSLESNTHLNFAHLITKFENAVLSDQVINACCCCESPLRKKDITSIRLSDNFGIIWNDLKNHITNSNSSATEKQVICKYCKKEIKQNRMPARGVLNGLFNEPIPPELQGLCALSVQLIQLSKPFQTVMKLGTYTRKVPTYNSLQACRGTTFFLPLPLEKNAVTLADIEASKTV